MYKSVPQLPAVFKAYQILPLEPKEKPEVKYIVFLVTHASAKGLNWKMEKRT